MPVLWPLAERIFIVRAYINICIVAKTHSIQMQSPKYLGCASRKVPSDDGNFSVWGSVNRLGIELHIQGSQMVSGGVPYDNYLSGN